MEEHDFALQPAYAFLRSKGFAKEANMIREAKLGLNESVLKRGMVLSVVERNGLLEAFLTDQWPRGITSEIRQEVERLKRIYERYQQSKTLTCEQITEAVQKYNSDPSLKKHDLARRATLTAVHTLSPSLGRFVAEVCVVADWGSIPLDSFPFADRLAIAEEIDTRWQDLLQPMQSQHADCWGIETMMLLRAVDDLAGRTVLLPTLGARGRQLSFLSKYLHFCINDGFPVWDSNALMVLRGNDERTWVSYKDWLSRVRQEVAKHRQCLKQVQRPSESLVRTLDKALYTIGSDIMA